jgi:mono/diheme cytochrome c family protein
MNRFTVLASILLLLGANSAFAQPASKTAQPSGSLDEQAFTKAVVPFLKEHCVSCHGPDKQRGDLTVHDLKLDGLKAGESANVWRGILERVATGNMPPDSRPRPDRVQAARVVAWIRDSLIRVGHASELEFPHKGNLVPHELLFGPSADLKAKPASPLRIWRVTPQQYDALWVDAKVISPHPGPEGKPGQFSRYKQDRNRVPAPFSFKGGTGFQDFAALYRIDEAGTEQLLLNARAIADKLIGVSTGKGGLGEVAKGAPKPYLDIFNASGKPSAGQIQAVLKQSFQTVLRREPDADESASYNKFIEAQCAKFGNQIGLKNFVAAVVLHPESLYRLELGDGKPDEYGRVMLAPRELAFAISFALTDAPPDRDLLAALGDGRLRSKNDVAREVARLLKNDVRSNPRILRFFQEYFGYTVASSVFKDGKVFDTKQREVLVTDTDLLIESILSTDRNVLSELLTTTRSYNLPGIGAVESHAARVYGYPADAKDKPFTVPAEQRAGILTQPSWLIAHSAANDNDAVRRGKWVRERLLGDAIPEVPITVEAQLPDEPDQTLRHRMRVTREAYCLQCHQRMDPLGLAFEMFDDWGAFRTKELMPADRLDERRGKLGGKKPNRDGGVPVDSSGEVIGAIDPALNGKVANAIELTQRLAKSEHVQQVFVRHAFRYWMGRNETPEDAPTLQNAFKAYKDNDGSMKALLLSLLTSDSFLYRRESSGIGFQPVLSK